MVASSATQQNNLTDGQLTVTYAALPTRLTAFAGYREDHRLEQDQCLVVG